MLCVRCLENRADNFSHACEQCEEELKREAEAARLVAALRGESPSLWDGLSTKEQYEKHVLNICPDFCGFCKDERMEMLAFLNQTTVTAIKEELKAREAGKEA